VEVVSPLSNGIAVTSTASVASELLPPPSVRVGGTGVAGACGMKKLSAKKPMVNKIPNKPQPIEPPISAFSIGFCWRRLRIFERKLLGGATTGRLTALLAGG